jgi:hypothetical protein
LLSRRGGFGAGGQVGESGGVFDGEVGEDFAVEADACGFEAVNQLAIAEAVEASGGADALNPEFAIFAFLDAAIALGVTIGAIGGFLGALVELALGQEEAFSPFEIFFAASPAFGAAFYACHGFFSLSFLEATCSARRKSAEESTGLKTRHYNGFVFWETNGLRIAEEKACRNGFVSVVRFAEAQAAKPAR